MKYHNADKLLFGLLFPFALTKINKGRDKADRITGRSVGVLFTVYYIGAAFGNYVPTSAIWSTGLNFFFRLYYDELKEQLEHFYRLGYLDKQITFRQNRQSNRYSLTISGLNLINSFMDAMDEKHARIKTKKKQTKIGI